jgi:hypothetical protein
MYLLPPTSRTQTETSENESNRNTTGVAKNSTTKRNKKNKPEAKSFREQLRLIESLRENPD